MVDITDRLTAIKKMIDRGDYFTINRARQYGKTTTLIALSDFLKEDYLVVSLDFQMLGTEAFRTESAFVAAFSRLILRAMRHEKIPSSVFERLNNYADNNHTNNSMDELFFLLGDWCEQSEKPNVLLIDEIDTASNYSIFLDFLAQLRAAYISRNQQPTFQSVILAGVYDIKNLKRKFVSEGQHNTNSPWNIAADYLIDMSFSKKDISGMLYEYEQDYKTGMDINYIAGFIYDYTAGYPFLVSRICQLLDEQIAGTPAFPDRKAAWSTLGLKEAVSHLISEKNTLFESLTDKVESYPDLKELLYYLLMNGKEITYNPDHVAIDIALMFGFVKVEEKKVVISNRIFETRLYNMFLTSPEMQKSEMYSLGSRDKYQFIQGSQLNMERILERFVICFNDLYGDQPQKFKEEDGRRYFLLYLRPIINGRGNYYIESQTRNQERTDVIVDYCGHQYIIELKIWHGNTYHTRGEQQLTDYLNHYHTKKGYMLSFNFNKKKEIGVKHIILGDKILIEAVV
ncbi:MAG: AAA-like domain-containing protein [Clostridiales bacterium]|nr:AAA-like domain-containing protein [Clostridiales bacterium]